MTTSPETIEQLANLVNDSRYFTHPADCQN